MEDRPIVILSGFWMILLVCYRIKNNFLSKVKSMVYLWADFSRLKCENSFESNVYLFVPSIILCEFIH